MKTFETFCLLFVEARILLTIITTNSESFGPS